MNREQIVEGLKHLKAYEAAINGFERHVPIEPQNHNPLVAAGCRVTLYSDMPTGTGAGSRSPALTGGWSLEDALAYNQCQYMSRWLRLALATLYEDERKVVLLKYTDGLTLKQIAERTFVSGGKTKSLHKSGMDKMDTCLRFVEYVEKSPVAA